MADRPISQAKKRRLESLKAAKKPEGLAADKPKAAAAGKASKKRPLEAAAAPVAGAAGAPQQLLPDGTTSRQQQQQQRAAAASSHPYNKLDLGSLPSHLLQQLHLQDPRTAGNSSSSSSQQTIPDLLEALMSRSMPPQVARNMISTRTRDKQILLDNPTAALSHVGRGRDPRRQQQQQQLAAQLLPRGKRQALCQLPGEIPPAALQPLEALWQVYVQKVLAGGPTDAALRARLAEADWHGSRLSVVSSKAPGCLGCSGVVVKDTRETWVLVGPDGRPRVVPKRGCVARCELPGGTEVVLRGDELVAAAAAAAVRKNKKRKGQG